MIEFYLVDVKNISSNIPRSNFVESDLENLADIILESGGVIKPLILKATGVETYTVIDGHFEYYAAVRAREKEPRKGEMVNAFVISPKKEDIIVKQISAITSVENATKAETQQLLGSSNSLTPTYSETQQLKNILQKFEKSLQQKLENINNKTDQVSTHSNTNISSKSETIDIEGLSKKLEKLIEEKLQPIIKQIQEMDAKLNKFGYYNMTVNQLKVIAKERQIKERSKLTTKDKLITAIIKFESSQS